MFPVRFADVDPASRQLSRTAPALGHPLLGRPSSTRVARAMSDSVFAKGNGDEPDPPSEVIDERPETEELISTVERAGNVTRELSTTAFDGDFANPSEILPTNEGITLFRGAGAEQNGSSAHPRRNGWHPDGKLEVVWRWIERRNEKDRGSHDVGTPPPRGGS
jgi:hypothetical protein